ncbi:MAG: transcriptional regulator [Chloroflexi bacterium]|nr:MAG: transcriptional regulator [Chloroflexota bacterium]
MSRLNSRTARLRRLEEILFLTPKGLKVTELAEALGVDRRTIYRDLDFLDGQGVPIWQENGRFGINRTRYLTTIRLTYHESIALVLAGLLLSHAIDERNPHVSTALRKVAATLPRPLSGHLQRAAERIQANMDGTHVAVLETIAEGWGTGHKVRIGYRSPRSGKLRQRTIAPYALEPTPFGIYIICYDEWAEDIRTFKLDRLESAVLLSTRYTIPNDFDLEAHLGTAWRIMAGDSTQEVVLRFQPEVTPQVRERRWHPTQRLEETADNGCILCVTVAQPREMLPWIRSWGAQVEVLAPNWLRDLVANDFRQGVLLYKSSQK